MSSESTLRILRMVSEGKITAEEAEELLKAIDGTRPEARNITVLVFDKGGEKATVNVSLPLTLARFAMNFIPSSVMAKQDVPIEDIFAALNAAQPGKVFEIKEEDGRRVEIYLH